MLLSISKQLKKETADRIRNIHQKSDFLINLPDNDFLEKEAKAKTITWPVGGWTKILIKQNVAPILVPEYELSGSYKGNMYYPTFLAAPKLQELNFFIFLTRDHMQHYSSSIRTCVEDEKKHLIAYNLDPIKWHSNGNIYTLATYFYNKISVYNKIQELLIKNIESLNEQMGETYLEDLILLFSGKKEKVKTYNIYAKNISEEYVDKNVVNPKKEKISKAKAIYYKKDTASVVDTFLSLDKDNLLYWDFDLQNLDGQIQKEQFYKFINSQTNAWLLSLEQSTNLGMNIYEKVKIKILMENT